MTDPYQVLGISPNATDEQMKTAYRELARKYHPDNYSNNPLADLAQEKMKQINEAYDTIQRQRKQQTSSGYQQSSYQQNSYQGAYRTQQQSGSYQSQGASQFSDIRNMINSKRVSEAEELLEGVPNGRRDGEWQFLRGSVFYTRGWLDEAYNCYVRATQMSPGNPEYQNALNQLLWQRNTARPAGSGYGEYRKVQPSGCSGCDMCTSLICADCCCECMGGDLIGCC